MGLFAGFTPTDLGYPETLSQSIDGEYIEVEVDYSEACEAFCDEFYDIATTLVPVDTGYLESTIDAWTDGFYCECFADAEYAQYVEYGTWKMAAQPYFEPAIAQALEAFHEEAQSALDDAQDEIMDACEEIVADVAVSYGFWDGNGLLSTVGNLVFGGLALFVLFPLLVNLYGIVDTIFGTFKETRYRGPSSALEAAGIEVIIT